MKVFSGQYQLKEIHVRWAGIFLVAWIMTFFYPIEEGETPLTHYLISLTFTTIYWNLAFVIFMRFRKEYPELKQTPKRLVLTFVAVLLVFMIVDPILCYVLVHRDLSAELAFEHWITYLPVNVTAAAVIGSVYENVYFFEQWKKTIQLNEALKNQQVRTQFEVLQNQMSPHFLFNSLNTLTALISEDKKTATEFTQKLSEVYRYILANKDKDLVLLREELEFAEAYLYLLKMRYPKNLNATFLVSDEHQKQYIAPLTIQMLVENAIKHNVISKAHPLHIEVYIENDKSIVVKNNLQSKKVIEKSTKTGLSNIRKRYEYFGNQNIDIVTTAKNYLVAVPLIQLVRERDQTLTAGL